MTACFLPKEGEPFVVEISDHQKDWPEVQDDLREKNGNGTLCVPFFMTTMAEIIIIGGIEGGK